MINYSEDAFAAMLLTMALSPDKEEYARPCSVSEFRALETAVRHSRFGRIGNMVDIDVSALQMYLGIEDKEALRLFTLLSRSVQLVYVLEQLDAQGIEPVTCYDEIYPRRVARKLGADAPVFFFRGGNPELARGGRAVALIGVRGVRTSEAVRKTIATLVREVSARGCAIITGGEPGVSRVAAHEAQACGGRLLEVLGGGLSERLTQPDFKAMGDNAAALSLVHPDALFTSRHAAARNRLLMSLSDAAFIFNTDGRRGESELTRGRLCDWI